MQKKLENVGLLKSLSGVDIYHMFMISLGGGGGGAESNLTYMHDGYCPQMGSRIHLGCAK